jgi:hypothetical protein
LATKEARKLQRDLGKLAATCKYLNVVASEHRFHSFIMQHDPHYRPSNLTIIRLYHDIPQVKRFHNKALPELMERLIQYSRLRQEMRYLSIRDRTLAYKAGVTKRRLGLFLSASRDHGIEVPSFVPALLDLPEYSSRSRTPLSGLRFWLDGELWLADRTQDPGRSRSFNVWMIKLLLLGLAPRLKKLLIDPQFAEDIFCPGQPPAVTLPSVVNMVVPGPIGTFVPGPGTFVLLLPSADFRMELLLRSFPNLRSFQNHDPSLTSRPVVRDHAQSPLLLPNLRRLLLSGEQAAHQEQVTAILRQFPQLEELHYHRSQGVFMGGHPDFCNADIFNGVHHCLRKLTYSSASVVQDSNQNNYNIKILCYEEPQFTDVPHFGAFAILEDLTIDQALLGRMSTIRDRIESPVGPYFPDLAWHLPQSLRRLAFHYVHDWPQLASQLTSVASAKNSGQFPHLRDICVVVVRSGTVVYNFACLPHIPLPPREDFLPMTGEMLFEAGINLWVSGAIIGPPPRELEDYPRVSIPPGKAINFEVMRAFFREP